TALERQGHFRAVGRRHGRHIGALVHLDRKILGRARELVLVVGPREILREGVAGTRARHAPDEGRAREQRYQANRNRGSVGLLWMKSVRCLMRTFHLFHESSSADRKACGSSVILT